MLRNVLKNESFESPETAPAYTKLGSKFHQRAAYTKIRFFKTFLSIKHPLCHNKMQKMKLDQYFQEKVPFYEFSYCIDELVQAAAIYNNHYFQYILLW